VGGSFYVSRVGCPHGGAARVTSPAQAKLPFDPQLIDLKKIADARRLFELEQLEVS